MDTAAGRANACSLCASERTKRLHVSTAGEVFRCKDCGVVFFRSQVDTDALYDDAYFTQNYATIKEAQRAKAESYVSHIRRFQESGSLLDYGCGSGVFLAAAAAAGFSENAGVDVSDAALELAGQDLEPRDRLINPTRDDIGEQKFDVVTFLDSAAHIPDFRSLFFSLAEHNMQPGGVLFIRTPNLNRLYLFYVRCLSFVLPAEYVDELYFIPKRYLLFNRQAIHRFLESNGFEVLESVTAGDYRRASPAVSFKTHVRNLLFRRIPRWLNPRNSLVLLARMPAAN